MSNIRPTNLCSYKNALKWRSFGNGTEDARTRKNLNFPIPCEGSRYVSQSRYRALKSIFAVKQKPKDSSEEALELIFHVKIDDLYRSFIDIANRKKEQIKFVNKLEVFLKRKIEEQDGMS